MDGQPPRSQQRRGELAAKDVTKPLKLSTMATRQQAIKAAAIYGATITEPESFDEGRSYTVEADAPEGMQWKEGPLSLVARYWPKEDKASKGEAYADLIERMQCGIEPIDNELNPQ